MIDHSIAVFVPSARWRRSGELHGAAKRVIGAGNPLRGGQSTHDYPHTKRPLQRLRHKSARRRRTYAQEFPDFFDGDLRKLFVDSAAAPDSERAAAFVRRSNKLILNAVSAWTGEPKFTISRLLRGLTERCGELDLRLKSPSAPVEITAYLATLASHYRLTGKFKDS